MKHLAPSRLNQCGPLTSSHRRRAVLLKKGLQQKRLCSSSPSKSTQVSWVETEILWVLHMQCQVLWVGFCAQSLCLSCTVTISICQHPAHPAGGKKNGTSRANISIISFPTVRPGSSPLLVLGSLGKVERSCHCDAFPFLIRGIFSSGD